MISLAVASIAMVSFAQQTVSETIPTLKDRVVTNSFGSNWFLGGNVGVNLFSPAFDSDESLFDHMSPALQIYAGKWHTPGYGWRVAYNGLNIQAFEAYPHKTFMNFHFDAMFNLTNLIAGYDADRLWTVGAYFGGGWAGKKEITRDEIAGSITLNTGLTSTWNINKHLDINLEVAATIFRNGFGEKFAVSGHDMMFSVLGGVAYKFNKTGWEQAADVDALVAMNAAALAEMNAQLQAKEAENAGLKNQLAAAKASLVQAQEALKIAEGKVITVSQSVFFAFNSSKIASKKEIINLQSLADAVKNSNAKLSVAGYADSATGSAEYNQKLSVARAQAVADKLIEMGVPQEKLIVEGKGGVDAEKPARLNRRVIVSIVE